MEQQYDVVVVGAGSAGLFCCYELITKKPSLKILLIEQGNDITRRKCPIINNNSKCCHCNPCNIVNGVGGSGSFSDGKFNFSTQFGGWLTDYLSEELIMELIYDVDSIYKKFGATDKIYYTNSELRQQALQYDLHLLEAGVKHLGTENNFRLMSELVNFLRDKITIKCNSKVESIINANTIQLSNGDIINGKYLVVAPGRIGSEWFSEQCKKLNIPLTNNRVDIGVRVECDADIFKHITDTVYEAKLLYRTKKYNDVVRTFCMNPYGQVVEENNHGIITVNGHSYADENLRSKNTNFALLVSNTMTEPFDSPNQYGKRIASLSNLLGDGIIVQRFGDLINGRRSNEKRMKKSFVKPTLSATAGDLSLVLPKRQLDDIIEMIYALDNIAPGIKNDDTLLYGVEVKFYSSRPKLNSHLQMDNGIYAIGDGAGITRGLSQASASGVYVARDICMDMEWKEVNNG